MRLGKFSASIAAWMLAIIAAASAAQQLIPAPYPEVLGGTAILPERAPRASRHQHLLAEPVPQGVQSAPLRQKFKLRPRISAGDSSDAYLN
jgi:hypothetical protein